MYAETVTGVSKVEENPQDPDIDESGVDREQIRAMLRLTPEERLRTIQAFVESAMEIWERNGARAVR